MRRFVTVTIGLLLCAVLLVACGDEGESSDTTAASADLDRFCELGRQLDEEGTKVFGELEQDKNATQEDFEQAEADFIEDNAAVLDEVTQVAPEEIKDQVEVLVQAQRARAGLGDEPEGDEQKAEQEIQKFESENCAEGGDDNG